jgi:hypothetical protein
MELTLEQRRAALRTLGMSDEETDKQWAQQQQQEDQAKVSTVEANRKKIIDDMRTAGIIP